MSGRKHGEPGGVSPRSLTQRLRGVPDACDSTKVEDQVRFLAEILIAGVAQLAAHRTRNAARVSSTLTAGSGKQKSEIRDQRSEVGDQSRNNPLTSDL